MSKLAERIFVRCPLGRAPSYMKRYLDTLGGAHQNGKISLNLKVPLDETGLPGAPTLSREVIAEFTPIDDPASLQKGTAIHWKPKGSGPIPKFVGVLTIESDENYASSWLKLQGVFDPPVGVRGNFLDEGVAQRTAHAIASALLYELRAAIERTQPEALTPSDQYVTWGALALRAHRFSKRPVFSVKRMR